MLKKNKFKFLILSSKYRDKSKIEKDYYYHITNSLKYLNYKFLLVQFDKKNNIKNIKEIKSFLKKRNVIILAEGNIEYNYLYYVNLIYVRPECKAYKNNTLAFSMELKLSN